MRVCSAVCQPLLIRLLVAGAKRAKHFGLAVGLALLSGCQPASEQPVRIASVNWPGYWPLYFAEQRGYLNAHLTELPSSSEVMRSFRNGAIDFAPLTGDEVLSLREEDFDVRVVAVMDMSAGADAIVAKPPIERVADLRGRRVGVETTATGAYVLARALQIAGVTPSEVTVVGVDFGSHLDAYKSGAVDAVVTFEPNRSLLLQVGARQIFDSRAIPGEVCDVLAVRGDFFDAHPEAVERFLRTWFRAARDMHANVELAAQLLEPLTKLDTTGFRAALAGIEVPDETRNRALFAGSLEQSFRNMMRLMMEQHLLKRAPNLDDLLVHVPLAKERP